MRAALRKAKESLLGPGIRRNVCRTRHHRSALLMYQVASFGSGPPGAHQNIGQARELARALDEHGYNVDVVNYDERRRGLLGPSYDLVIDLHPAESRSIREGWRRERFESDTSPAAIRSLATPPNASGSPISSDAAASGSSRGARVRCSRRRRWNRSTPCS